MRFFCGNARELSLSFQDNTGHEFLRFERPLRCMDCCCNPCYPHYTQVLKNTQQYFSMIYLTGDTIDRIDIVSRCFEKKTIIVLKQNLAKMPFVYYLQIHDLATLLPGRPSCRVARYGFANFLIINKWHFYKILFHNNYCFYFQYIQIQ